MSSRVKQAADTIREAVRNLSPSDLLLLKEDLERDLPLNPLVGIQEPLESTRDRFRGGIMTIQEIAYHRNGIGGAPFNVVTFTDDRDSDVAGRQMVAVVFPEYEVATAVFDRELLGQGVIAFMKNSYRGDHFDAELREAIDTWEKVR